MRIDEQKNICFPRKIMKGIEYGLASLSSLGFWVKNCIYVSTWKSNPGPSIVIVTDEMDRVFDG